jgi:sugar PTS system EIIA component
MFKKQVDDASIPEHKKSFTLISPIAGKVLPLVSAYDTLFSHRLFGEGVVIEPAGYQVLAPFKGQVIHLEDTANQIIIRAENGLQFMLQLGFDSYLMMGLGFKARVKKGDSFSQNQVLLEFDLNQMRQQLISVQCPITLLNSDKIKAIVPHYFKVLAGQDKLMTIYW